MRARIGTATEGDAVELECAQLEGGQSPGAGDLALIATVRCGDFRGRSDCWVERTAWSAFLRDVRDLERTRRGSATLESISPHELRLTLRATDHAGHMAIEGMIGVRTGHSEVALHFSSIAFDPSDLPEITRRLSQFSPL